MTTQALFQIPVVIGFLIALLGVASYYVGRYSGHEQTGFLSLIGSALINAYSSTVYTSWGMYYTYSWFGFVGGVLLWGIPKVGRECWNHLFA